jgi:hypothetical protein
VLLTVACQAGAPAPVPPDRRGTIAGAAPDVPSPQGLEPAYVWEIDGARVPQGTARHPVEPGSRVIRVWPNTNESMFRLVPDPVEIDVNRIDVEALEIAVEPGHAYVVAARRDRFEVRSTLPGGRIQTGGWHYRIPPVVISAAPPATLVEAAEGFGWIVLFVASSALIVPLFF